MILDRVYLFKQAGTNIPFQNISEILSPNTKILVNSKNFK